MKRILLFACTTFFAMVVFSTIVANAQVRRTESTHSTGRFHLEKSVRISGKALAAGMYQVEHLDENGDHFITFRMVKMGFRENMGNQEVRQEIMRVRCSVVPADNKIKHTKLLVRNNAQGNREGFEILIRGERVRHILLPL